MSGTECESFTLPVPELAAAGYCGGVRLTCNKPEATDVLQFIKDPESVWIWARSRAFVQARETRVYERYGGPEKIQIKVDDHVYVRASPVAVEY